jgi:hypothetical protein
MRGKLIRAVFWLIFMMLEFISIESAIAGAAEEEILAAFEVFCISNLKNPEDVHELFADIRVSPLTEDEAAPFLAPQKGTAWLIDGENTMFIMLLTENGVRPVNATDVDGEEVERLFATHIVATKLGDEPLGSERQAFYAVTYPDPTMDKQGRAVVSIRTSKLSSVRGVMINTLPEALARQNGVTLPK